VQITYEQTAWIDPSYMSIEAIRFGKTTPILAGPPSAGDYFEKKGYVPIGTATVTLKFSTDEEIANEQLKGLNSQLQAVRAEAQVKENAILLQISKLQSLTMG